MGFTRGRNYPSTVSVTVFSQRDSVQLVKTEFLDQDFGPADILTHSVTEKPIAIDHRSRTLEEYGKQLSRSQLFILARRLDFPYAKCFHSKTGYAPFGNQVSFLLGLLPSPNTANFT